MSHPAFLLIGLGVVMVVAGIAWLLLPSMPRPGRLPGDISIESENSRFYFPITTCIVLSLLLSGVMWLLRYFWR